MTAQAPLPIRDAASVVLLRDRATRPRVLMGQRGKDAVFLPSKYVFPGGALDAVDAEVPLARPPRAKVAQRLGDGWNGPQAPEALIATAIRELWEETGLLLGARDARAGQIPAPRGWRGYLGRGYLPDGGALDYIFRAVTPPGRPRRFDARFFLADAEDLATDADDFSGAEDELSHLAWVPLDAARAFDMAFITEVVLAEIAAIIAGRSADGVPFFDNSTELSRFRRIL